MNLNTKKWEYFKIKDLFKVNYGVNLELNACEETTLGDPKAINFVSRTQENNGVSAYVKPIEGIKAQDAGIITVAGGGSVLSTFVQSAPFYSGRDLYLLIPKEEYKSMSLKAKLFICTVIMSNKYRYNYGRQANKTLPDLELKLPAIDKNTPDWEFMENYIKSLHSKPLTTKNNNKKISALNVDKWKEFSLDELFEIKKGKRLTSEDQEEGNHNYVGAIDSNNGIANHIAQKPIHEANTITLSYNGSVGEAFYQDEPYWATDDVNALYPRCKEFNKSIGLFICAVIRQEKYRFSYGRKWTLENMKITKIKLPAKQVKKGQYVPDWEFMENYIKTLPYGDRI